jgi:hypothetical protein
MGMLRTCAACLAPRLQEHPLIGAPPPDPPPPRAHQTKTFGDTAAGTFEEEEAATAAARKQALSAIPGAPAHRPPALAPRPARFGPPPIPPTPRVPSPRPLLNPSLSLSPPKGMVGPNELPDDGMADT